MFLGRAPVIVMVSSPSSPYDVGKMRSESRPHALIERAPSIDFLSSAGRALPPRAFQTLVSHEDVLRTVALNRDAVIAIISLRRRGDEIRVTAARSQRAPSIDFRSAAGRALPPRAFQTLISHVDAARTVARNRDGVLAFPSLRRRGDEIRVTAARSQRVPSINVLSAAGRALPPHLPDTDFARGLSQHRRP